MNKVDRWFAYLLPRRCVLCNTPSGDDSVCPGCCSDLPWLGPCCNGCAVPLPPGVADGFCGNCAGRPFAPDRTVAALAYEFPVDRLVTGAKFHRRFHMAEALGEALVHAIGQNLRGRELPELLVPVPLHRRRQAERGYNQALEIARPVARRLGLVLAPGACRRIRATVEQTGLSAAARRRNLRGAFAAGASCAGRSIAILDDVFTTGSTASAVAAAVRRAGARRVEVWAAARTM